MSYQVLARKWRPQTFEQIRGQAHIARALSNAIASNRIAHAYLFTGIRGVGKTSAARVLAKALNCVEGPTPTPCNACESCREITAGRSPDVLEIDGASNTGVDDVRRLREAVRYPPVRGPYRIYIIDEVHMLSTAAFNALLKTLEEPPEHVVFVFATTDAHKIPVTILSRCQQFDFKRLSPRELIQLLGDVAQAEGVTVEEKGLAALAREAEGSVRDGQSLLDQVISYAGRTVRYEDVRDVLGVVDRDLVMGVARCVVGKDSRGVLENLVEAERYGYDARRFSIDLLDLFRDLSVLRGVDDGGDLVDLTAEEVAEAEPFLEDVTWDELHALFDMLARGVEHLRSASRPETVLEMTLLKMANLPPLLSLRDLVGRVSEAEPPARPLLSGERRATSHGRTDGRLPPVNASAAEGTPSPSGKPERSPPPQSKHGPGDTDDPTSSRARFDVVPTAAAAVAPEPPEPRTGVPLDPQELWQAVLRRAETGNRPFWSVLAAHAQLQEWDEAGRRAVIAYDDPSHEFFLRAKLELLAGWFADEVGIKPIHVELSCAGAPRSGRAAGQDTDRARSIKREAFEHPLVRDAVEVFDGDIEEVRVLKS